MLKELNNIYNLSQLIIFGIIFLLAFYFYYFKKDKLKFLINPFGKLRIDAELSRSINPFGKLRIDAELSRSINKLIVAALSFSAILAIVKTINQYYAWSGNELSRLLLPPHQSIKYFIFYAFSRFWLGVLIGAGVSFLFYLFLKFLEKRQSRFFIEGETGLGFLAALISGWPNFVIFLPLVFIFTVLIAVYRRLVLKESYTTLGYSFLLGALVVFVFGNKIIEILNLVVLRI